VAEPRLIVSVTTGGQTAEALARTLSAVRPASNLAADLLLVGPSAAAVRDAVVWACGTVLNEAPAGAPHLSIGAGVSLSPFALGFVSAALTQADDQRVGAISLTRPADRRPGEPFLPLQDGSDVFYASTPPGPASLSLGAGRGDATLFPRAPVATRPGHGLAVGMDRAARDWRVVSLDQSLAVYDAGLELTPEAMRRAAPHLPDLDFAVDLFGDRADVTAPYLLSSRPCSAPLATWGLELTPLEANIALNRPGQVFSLGPTSSFATLDQMQRLHLRQHLNRHFDMGAFVGQFLGPFGRLVGRKA